MKKLLAIMLVIVLAFALSVSALAYNLPIPPNSIENSGNLGQWITDGTDQATGIDFKFDTFKSSTGIVFHMPEPEVGMVIVVFGAFNGWDWGGGSIDIAAEAWDDGKVTVRWSDIGINITGEDDDDGGGHVKILFGSWSAQYNDLGITRAQLLVAGGGGGAPATGVSFFLFPALALMGLGTTGAIVVGKKIKK